MRIETDGPVLALSGDFDARSTAGARTALYGRLAEHADVVVDLTDVRCIDVTALRVLAAASRKAATDGGHVRLRGCNDAVRRLLHLTHLIRVLEIERPHVAV